MPYDVTNRFLARRVGFVFCNTLDTGINSDFQEIKFGGGGLGGGIWGRCLATPPLPLPLCLSAFQTFWGGGEVFLRKNSKQERKMEDG